MKVELTIKERIMLLNVMPQAKSLASMRVVKDLGHKLGLALEEFEKWGVSEAPGRIEWKVPDKETATELDFAKKELDIIGEALHELDEQEKVDVEHLVLFDKFGIE
jgi:hypothetical protein